MGIRSKGTYFSPNGVRAISRRSSESEYLRIRNSHLPDPDRVAANAKIGLTAATPFGVGELEFIFPVVFAPLKPPASSLHSFPNISK